MLGLSNENRNRKSSSEMPGQSHKLDRRYTLMPLEKNNIRTNMLAIKMAISKRVERVVFDDFLISWRRADIGIVV